MNSFSQENLPDLELTVPIVESSPAAAFSSARKAVGEKYVIFFLNEEVYAVSARCVTEVIVPLRLTPLPKTPEWFLGIANLRGKIISVIDLPRFWNREKSPSAPHPKLILLSSETSDSQIAFAVDKLSEIIALLNADIQSDFDCSPDFCGKIKYKSDVIHLLDAEKLFLSLAGARLHESAVRTPGIKYGSQNRQFHS